MSWQSLICRVFRHHWTGCRCSRCGCTRDIEHRWDKCACAQCGVVNHEMHKWEHCKCTICGLCRDTDHDWDGCMCRLCGFHREESHALNDCCKCGKCERYVHLWITGQDLCRRCGAKPCPDCNGNGSIQFGDTYGVDGAIIRLGELVDCSTCHGRGFIRDAKALDEFLWAEYEHNRS